MTGEVFAGLQYLERKAAPPLGTVAEREARTSFLRKSPDMQSAGFNLATGGISPLFSRIRFGEWEEPAGEMSADQDVSVLRSLHERSVSTWREMAQTLQEVHDDDDPSLNAAGRLKLAAKIVGPKLQQLMKVADQELAKVQARIDDEEAKVQGVIRDRARDDATLHDSIRRHVYENGVNLTAVAQGKLDLDTLCAIGSAPAYLSKIDGTSYRMVREQLAERIVPEQSQRIKALQLSKARALQAVTTVDNLAKSLIDFDKAAELSIRERQRDS